MKFIEIKLSELVDMFGGEVHSFSNEIPPTLDHIRLCAIKGLEDAKCMNLSFLSNTKLKSLLLSTQAVVVMLKKNQFESTRQWCLEQVETSNTHLPLVWLVDDPYLMYAQVQQWWVACSQKKILYGIHSSAVVDASAIVHETAYIGPNAVIGAGTQIGAHCNIGAGVVLGEYIQVGDYTQLHPNAVVYNECEIGKHCLIHSGAIIGADGFGFANDKGEWVKIPQVGRVLISDQVEIGANTTIDRGALGDTLIGFGVKLDNQIQIAHNVQIGEHTAFAACAGVAGSTKIGARCTIGGAANIVGHISIVDGTHISATTMVTHSIREPGSYTGFFPMDTHKSWEKTAAALRQIMKLRSDVRDLKNKNT